MDRPLNTHVHAEKRAHTHIHIEHMLLVRDFLAASAIFLCMGSVEASLRHTM